MSGISTHILDTSRGRPAAGVPVTLESELSGGWRELSSHITDGDGRVKQLLPAGEELAEGSYRISFAVAAYFAANNAEGLYPQIQITFQVRNRAEHFHIPLLLTANGYTTYRGS